ncbi:MAG: hypothetical protein ABH950_00265 [Candidatus Altiarchaeota archaeon]
MAKKKNITSWKNKKKYTIYAPESFEKKELKSTIASDPKQLIGRTIDFSIRDLSGDRSKQHLKVLFEITDVQGDNAYTQAKMFDTLPGYLKSKVRKGMTKLDIQRKLNLKDKKIVLKMMVLTRGHIQEHQRVDLTKAIDKILNSMERKLKADEMIQQSLFGKVGTEIYQTLKRIHPIARVEVWQIKVL